MVAFPGSGHEHRHASRTEDTLAISVEHILHPRLERSRNRLHSRHSRLSVLDHVAQLVPPQTHLAAKEFSARDPRHLFRCFELTTNGLIRKPLWKEDDRAVQHALQQRLVCVEVEDLPNYGSFGFWGFFATGCDVHLFGFVCDLFVCDMFSCDLFRYDVHLFVCDRCYPRMAGGGGDRRRWSLLFHAPDDLSRIIGVFRAGRAVEPIVKQTGKVLWTNHDVLLQIPGAYVLTSVCEAHRCHLCDPLSPHLFCSVGAAGMFDVFLPVVASHGLRL